MKTYPIHSPHFFTATIYEWKHLLASDKHKNIIIDSLKFFRQRRCSIIIRKPASTTARAAVWSPTNGQLK